MPAPTAQVAAQPPASMAAMLGKSQGNEALGWPIAVPLAGGIGVAREPTIAAKIQVVAIEAHSHAACRSRGEKSRCICSAGSLGIVEDFDGAAAGDNHP